MSPQQLFGVIVRALGLIGCVLSLFYGISAAVAFFSPTYRPGISPWWHYVLSAVVLLVLGLFMLRKGDHIAAFAYGKKTSVETDA